MTTTDTKPLSGYTTPGARQIVARAIYRSGNAWQAHADRLTASVRDGEPLPIHLGVNVLELDVHGPPERLITSGCGCAASQRLKLAATCPRHSTRFGYDPAYRHVSRSELMRLTLNSPADFSHQLGR